MVISTLLQPLVCQSVMRDVLDLSLVAVFGGTGYRLLVLVLSVDNVFPMEDFLRGTGDSTDN